MLCFPGNIATVNAAPKNSTGLIVGIVATVMVIGTVVFFVIKKKKK